MSVLEQLTSLFAPDDCLHCGKEGSLLCGSCRTALPVLIGRCYGCKQKIPGASCKACLDESKLSSLTVASHYAGVAKLLVATLKFRGNQSAARFMAEAMLLEMPHPANALLVHMPATTSHVRERGFDQSKLIVKHLSRLSGLERADVLRRSGQKHQLGSDRAQRQKQLLSSLYVVRQSDVNKRNIVLVDDVFTTGSSLTAATKVLLGAGAATVHACAFAQSIR